MQVALPWQVVVLLTVLLVGPAVVRFLVGHPFKDFRIEARRPQAVSQ